MRKLIGFILALCAAVTITLTAGTTADARGVKLADATHKARPRAVAVVVIRDNTRWTEVTFTNGAAWRFTPCRFEDSRNCFWNAETRGNHKGRSFVNFKGRVVYLTHRTRVYEVHRTPEQDGAPVPSDGVSDWD